MYQQQRLGRYWIARVDERTCSRFQRNEERALAELQQLHHQRENER